jgi:hypothetical protein
VTIEIEKVKKLLDLLSDGENSPIVHRWDGSECCSYHLSEEVTDLVDELDASMMEVECKGCDHWNDINKKCRFFTVINGAPYGEDCIGFIKREPTYVS